jgi:hypothetical protein
VIAAQKDRQAARQAFLGRTGQCIGPADDLGGGVQMGGQGGRGLGRIGREVAQIQYIMPQIRQRRADSGHAIRVRPHQAALA